MNQPNAFTAKAIAEVLIGVINVEVAPFSEDQHSKLYHGDLQPLGKFPAYVSEGFMEMLRVEAARLNVEIDDKALTLLLWMGTQVGPTVLLLSAMVQTKFAGRVITCADIVSIWDGRPCPVGLQEAWSKCYSWIYLINTRKEHTYQPADWDQVEGRVDAQRKAHNWEMHPHQQEAVNKIADQLGIKTILHVEKGAGK